MASKSEIAEEQEFFDRADKAREKSRAAIADAAAAAAHPAAATHMRQFAKGHSEALGSADTAVAFGRMDDDESRLYVGRHVIRDDEGEVIVVSWQAPAAERFYQASHHEPHGLTRKRTFQCTGNLIDDFTDIVFAQMAGDPAGPDAGLLRELARGRTGTMRDIVATIQAAQFELIRAPLERMLVIEGGPGTGKTAVALHRVAWLLFNHRDRLRSTDVLIVGPHPTFTRYISTVLPSLGEDDVAQLDITKLAPALGRGRPEPPEVGRLKGQARMAGLLDRALSARIGVPEPAERLQVDGRFVTVPGAEIRDVIDTLKADGAPYAHRRARLREAVAQMVERRGVNPAVTRHTALENLVDRLWPQLTAPALLRDLFSSRERLLVAAGDEFTASEILQLRRRGADRLTEEIWSRDDLPLLDEAEFLINGGPQVRYAHIVVDEAQDLSPMQLRSIARRSASGSLTILGDLAQSTGKWARDSWDDVTSHLPARLPREVKTLRYGYRVPSQVYRFAAGLLPLASPATIPPEVVRDGPAEPAIFRVDPAERAGRAVAQAVSHTNDGRFVGIICPNTLRTDVEAALAANGVGWSSADRGELGNTINLISPQESKGLEFDAVVVIEPEDIVAGDERGHRLLYVALTRPVGYLDIVCAGEPLPLRSVDVKLTKAEEAAAPAPALDPTRLAWLAKDIGARLRRHSPPEQWEEVLREAARLLTPPS
ncbi:ATP-binding domain-containing protein [Phytohabitans sp. ZYX-F-186]|uniref:ATP-binding domain-containing protein n=1 Tax=Phytohabitans maris TaxID=3071409 RepID=A0ABU0ZVN4_9ACTN|nr:ATP-binding domain-containing protein [Phytohabitans sp. ZYX-F-186]MDQ7911003.1 ATP-binding domain-containing protein [Phytohabitans sp. ZYX-F-186]